MDYDKKTPAHIVDQGQVAKIMRINVDILKAEITEHVDKEIKRLNNEIERKRIR